MKFGDDKSPNTASFILQPKDKRPRIAHLTGLGFVEDSPVIIERAEHKLLFEGELEREVLDKSSGFPVTKMERYKSTKEIRVTDVQSIDITDESGRDLKKAALYGVAGAMIAGPIGLFAGALVGAKKKYKSFLIIQIKPENGISFPIVLGGANQKEVRAYYEHLINLVQ